MKHYGHLTEKQKESIFYKLPSEFNKNTPKEILSKALGATLYMPSTRGNFAQELINKKHPSLTSTVLDFEDAISADDVREGEENLIKNFRELKEALRNNQIRNEDLPLMFLRVRNVPQFKEIGRIAKELDLITGFVLPKFSTINADGYMDVLHEINETNNLNFYCMPILESKEIIYREYRLGELTYLKQLVDKNKDNVLNVRIGGTDFSSLYSIRRTIDTTIYDVGVVRDCIADILNMFNRAEDDYVVSGVVWEFFSNHSRLLKPTLRESPFIEEKGQEGRKERSHIITDAIDGLIKEVIYDKLNGIVGKTIIHPTHITYVNALQAITQEEYEDALMIVNNAGKGVIKSASGNKMNEIRPHFNWANKILQKAEIYGVIKNGKHYNSLF